MAGFIWHLSHDEANQAVAQDLGAEHGLTVQTRLLKEGLPDGDCLVLVVDLDSVATCRRDLERLVKELSGRPYPYPVAAFGYNLQDDQIDDLRAAGIQLFQRGLSPELFRRVAALASS